jgi:hypothetical protein
MNPRNAQIEKEGSVQGERWHTVTVSELKAPQLDMRSLKSIPLMCQNQY